MKMFSGQNLWQEAKNIIPGGNQLLSKQPEMFLPDQWPAYYEKAKGCQIWDLDGKSYLDFSHMSVGTCILGYADDDVNTAVIESIKKGSISTLNSWEEIAFAKELLGCHSWADQVRFSRTGGEACCIAIRIARAASGKEKVVFCGYHGWHDWYLSSNIGDEKQLDKQLLPGIDPKGVPEGLGNTTYPFQFGDINAVEKILHCHHEDVAAIIMEPVRETIDIQFLKEVKLLSQKYNVILIFDEITSGFRLNYGGAHKNFNVEPDMAIFGKAIGNGHPISAVIGKRKIMEAAQETFISSTYWTERVGFSAGLATLKKMKSIEAQKMVVNHGKAIRKGLNEAAVRAGVKMKIMGIDPLLHVSFDYADGDVVQTFFTQEMMEMGFLTGSAIYPTSVYSDQQIKSFLMASEAAFSDIAKAIQQNTVLKRLKGPVKHAGLRRLTAAKVT
ncbi:MAG: aminotransferase class III-fold pyridoxal phosphate-dependent enzyme [Candidatus Margulisbacteria bacterium]|nr:aminotransferase class III-fold pyridoxal phosphate-dependent enzyme [Candidatus Margulisiibacteriota bacterium]